MIIHINGAPGSGKTTIGSKLKSVLGPKVVVCDLDDLFREYMGASKFTVKGYQAFINKFITACRRRGHSIVFVGLNREHLTSHIYDVSADHKFWLDISVEQILQRHFIRELTGWLNWMRGRDAHILFNQLCADEKGVTRDLKASLGRVLSLSKQRKFIKSFKSAEHEKLSPDQTFQRVITLLR